MIKKILWIIIGLFSILCVGLGSFLILPQYDVGVVREGSMTPNINPGDLVFIKTFPKEIKPGMVIVYKKEGGDAIHRVISIEEEELITKGDAWDYTDLELFHFKVKVSNVKGVYLFKIPKLGYLCFSFQKAAQ